MGMTDTPKPASGSSHPTGAPSKAVRMTIEWHLPLGQTRSITSALNSLMVDIRGTRGCVGCSVLTGMSDRNSVRYSEEWRSEEDLRRRLESRAFTSLATLIDDATEAPRVEFALPGGTRGLDFLQEVRPHRD
jgi:quinol monooxygenase YgiN